jgi:hypothetical protein
MIGVRPYDDLAAMAVLSRLDASDLQEAQIVRGAEPINHLVLFHDWRAMRPFWIRSVIVTWVWQPVAVLALSHTGAAGVAQAAFLARDHARHRRALGEAACLIRAEMAAACRGAGIHRIEARAWAGHPSASRLLAGLGFHLEAEMPGFGPGGRHAFRQFAFTPRQET